MRWNETMQLVEVTRTRNDEGVLVEVEGDPRTVYCNQYGNANSQWIVANGESSWIAGNSSGLRTDRSIQVRTCDYNDEERAIYKGDSCEIDRVIVKGDFTILSLKKRIVDGGKGQ